MFAKFLSSAIRLSATFLYGSTGEIITQKSGHLNLGVPGVMSVGAASGYIIACLLFDAMGKSGAILIVLLSVLVAFITGAIMGAIYSFLTVTLKSNQNVTGLAMTTLGVGLAGYMISSNGNLSDLGGGASKCFRNLFTFYTSLGDFGQIFLSYGILVYLAIIIAIVAQIVLNKTKVGLHLRAVGENPATADATGINVTKYRYIATMIGCGISAIGGVFTIMDYMGGNWEYILEGFGWLSIALVIFTLWKPAFAIFGSIIFAGLYIVSSFVTGVSFAQNELLKLLPYVVTIIVLIITSVFDSKNAQPPASLGVNYFREDR